VNIVEIYKNIKKEGEEEEWLKKSNTNTNRDEFDQNTCSTYHNEPTYTANLC
jgi:hypothetical protein